MITTRRAKFFSVNVTAGFCHCGCGQKTIIAKYDRPELGQTKGQPIRFVRYHHLRNPNPQYILNDTGCWIWQHHLNNKGYGQIRIKGNLELAHRVFYEKAKGIIPVGMTLDHLCRNPACVNPNHLDPVTHAENIRRGKGTKLSMTQAMEIRQLYTNGKRVTELMNHFKVSRGCIRKLLGNRSWKI